MISPLARESKNGAAMHQCRIRSDLANRNIWELPAVTFFRMGLGAAGAGVCSQTAGVSAI
jgi:hypothetical protein